MAQRRTKQQKNKAAQRRSSGTGLSQVRTTTLAKQSQTPDLSTTLTQNQKKRDTHSTASLLRVDAQLLQKDLLRSLFSAFIILIFLIGIFLYLSYN